MATKTQKQAPATKKTPVKKKTVPKKKAATQSSKPGGVAKKIEERISKLGDWRGERLAEIRQLIHAADPKVIEEWKWRGTPVWSNQGMYVLADAFKDKVKVTFMHGAQLKDPKRLFNNGLDGNKWRAIDLYEGDKINKTAFKALLREAVAYNATHSVPKSKGSRA